MGGGALGGACGSPAPHARVRSLRQRTLEVAARASLCRSHTALLASLSIDKGHLGRVMSDEDSETPATELQGGEENELPIIQLCGLVEELRYGRPAGFWEFRGQLYNFLVSQHILF